MITLADISLLQPLIIVGVAAIIVMLSVAVKRNYLFANLVTLIAFLAAFLSTVLMNVDRSPVGVLFIIDGFGRFFMALILAAGFVITLLSYSYLKKQETTREEYFILLLIASLGSIAIVISNHFISFFLSLELLSISLYALIAYLKTQETAIEAGIKYLVLAAVSTAFLLFGVALIYAHTGRMDFSFASINLVSHETPDILFLAGLALVIVGIGFKLGIVPFHLWAPDVYAGAPPPVAAFISTVSKGSIVAFLFRLFSEMKDFQNNSIFVALSVVAIASMFIGNWLALREQSVKKILAFSSIAHLGYVLVAFLSASVLGMHAAAFYLTSYFIIMIGSFGAVAVLSGKENGAETVEDYKGLYQQKPWFAVYFTVMLLALAGFPLTSGFVADFYLLQAGAGSGLWLLMFCLIVSAVIGLFYYLRVVIALFSKKEKATPFYERLSSPTWIALAFLLILLVWIGVYPATLLHIIQEMI